MPPKVFECVVAYWNVTKKMAIEMWHKHPGRTNKFSSCPCDMQRIRKSCPLHHVPTPAFPASTRCTAQLPANRKQLLQRGVCGVRFQLVTRIHPMEIFFVILNNRHCMVVQVHVQVTTKVWRHASLSKYCQTQLDKARSRFSVQKKTPQSKQHSHPPESTSQGWVWGPEQLLVIQNRGTHQN